VKQGGNILSELFPEFCNSHGLFLDGVKLLGKWSFQKTNVLVASSTLRMLAPFLSPAIRLKAMLCDHVILCAVYIPLFIGVTALRVRGGTDDDGWGFGLLLGCYLNKDFFNGRSPAKRLLQLQVLDASGRPANELRCFLRNVTFFLWPLEVLVLLLGRRGRLGDALAGTQVSAVSKETRSWWQDLRTYRLTRYSAYTLAATLTYLLLLQIFSTHVLGL
jgi:uncharacterized RDD family membrane protein YckC